MSENISRYLNVIEMAELLPTWRLYGLVDILNPTKWQGRVVAQIVGGGVLLYAGYNIWREFNGAGEDLRAARPVRMAGCLWRFFTTTHDNLATRAYWQRELNLPKISESPGHSHARSAAARTAASVAIDQLASGLGKQVYVVSSSARDDPDAPTYHQWYIDKDLAFAPRNDPVPDNAIVKMIDVDYYVDWSEWIRHTRPVAIYTFVPDDVRYSCEEYTYSLRDKGVVMDVNGGRRYDHALWDYSNDYVFVRVRWWKWTLCTIDSKVVDRHHRLTLICPMLTVNWFGWLVPIRTLSRRVFKYGTALANVYRSAKGDQISLGLSTFGVAESSATIPCELWTAIKIRIANSKHPNISDVERYLRHERIETAPIDAPALFEIAKQRISAPLPAPSGGAGQLQPLRYQHAFPLVSEDGKELGRAVAPSLVTKPDFVPNRSYNNDFASVTGRVTKVLNDEEPPPRYLAYAKQFVNEVVGDQKGLGSPLEIQEVVELQSRPTQRGRSDKVLQWIGAVNPVSVRAFMKGESYQKPGDPRNISTVGAEHTLQLSAYTYAFKRDVLYRQPWYMPGKKPAEIADRIVTLARSFRVLSETDYSRLDGTVSRWLRTHVERASYLAWVADRYKTQLSSLLQAEINPRACTSNGLAYEPGSSVLSGSPLTTDSNTNTCTFVAYCAGREANLDHQTAYDLLGAAAGDDGVSPIKAIFLERAAGHLGLTLKCIRREEGHVNFLGRVFYDAGSGCNGSIQDPLRTWRKLHISFAPPTISDGQALANRAVGYLSLDPAAPVVSDWCRTVLRFIHQTGVIDSNSPYFVWLREQQPEIGGWPQLSRERAYEAISWRENIPVCDLKRLVCRIHAADNLSDLDSLHDNNHGRIEVTSVVAVNGQIQYPMGPSDSVTTLPVTRRPRGDARQRSRRPPATQPRPRTANPRGEVRGRIGRR